MIPLLHTEFGGCLEERLYGIVLPAKGAAFFTEYHFYLKELTNYSFGSFGV